MQPDVQRRRTRSWMGIARRRIGSEIDLGYARRYRSRSTGSRAPEVAVARCAHPCGLSSQPTRCRESQTLRRVLGRQVAQGSCTPCTLHRTFAKLRSELRLLTSEGFKDAF